MFSNLECFLAKRKEIRLANMQKHSTFWTVRRIQVWSTGTLRNPHELPSQSHSGNVVSDRNRPHTKKTWFLQIIAPKNTKTWTYFDFTIDWQKAWKTHPKLTGIMQLQILSELKQNLRKCSSQTCRNTVLSERCSGSKCDHWEPFGILTNYRVNRTQETWIPTRINPMREMHEFCG